MIEQTSMTAYQRTVYWDKEQTPIALLKKTVWIPYACQPIKNNTHPQDWQILSKYGQGRDHWRPKNGRRKKANMPDVSIGL